MENELTKDWVVLTVRDELDKKFETQLKPIKESLDKNTKDTADNKKWQLQMWSNGSGGPPGYMERSRAEDLEWKNSIIDEMKDSKKENLEWRTDLLAKLDPVIEYVVEKKAIDAQFEKTRNKWLKILTFAVAVLAVILALFTYLESHKVIKGELDNPMNWFSDNKIVYADENVTNDPTWQKAVTVEK